MTAVALDLPDEKLQRLEVVARARGTSVAQLFDEMSNVMVAEADAETRFRLRTQRGAGKEARGLELRDGPEVPCLQSRLADPQVRAALRTASVSIRCCRASMKRSCIAWRMTWWDDARLMAAADAMMPEEDQARMVVLSTNGPSSAAEQQELDALRTAYGQITLRKARATALLSIRGGKRLLAEADAA